jgi:hypothetical protein
MWHHRLTCPAKLTYSMPPHRHVRLQESLTAGKLPIRTARISGTHGAVVAGTHGIGVGTPMAAAAAITIGLAMLLHMPNGQTEHWRVVLNLGRPRTGRRTFSKRHRQQ